VPVALTVNMAFDPRLTTTLCGWAVMAGGIGTPFTIRALTALVTEPLKSLMIRL